MRQFDPRTKLALGLVGIGAVFVAKEPKTLFLESVLLLGSVVVLRMGRGWLHSLRLVWPMVGLVFAIAFFSFDIRVAVVLSLRLFNLLTVSFVFFHSLSPEELGEALNKVGVPYGFVFILTTSMRYVPLIGQKFRNIVDAQLSRGIDLRPRFRNLLNFPALLMPLLVQSLVLSEELAMAMESRGFGRKGRSSRRQHRIRFWEYGLIVASLLFLVAFAWWERGFGR